jgi:hypothetical protein
LVCSIENGKPTYEASTTYVSSFLTTGVYTLSGTLPSNPAALIYVFEISRIDFDLYCSNNYVVQYVEIDSLSLNQTIPQTIVNGIPLLQSTREITLDNQLVDKLFVESRMTGGMKSFFFTKTNSDVSGMYQAVNDIPTNSIQEITGISVDGETILASFITNVATAPYSVIDGSRFFHIIARTSNVSKATQLKGYVYQTDIDGANPVLLRTSTLSAILTEVDTEYSMSVWGGSLTIPTTMRIKFVISVVKIGTGVDPTITISVDDDTFSRLDVPSSIINLGFEFIYISCSDLITPLTAGVRKAFAYLDFGFKLISVYGSLGTVCTGSTFIFDVNNGANSFLNTKLSIDASENTSGTATTPAVINSTYENYVANTELSVDFDQVGSTIAGAGAGVLLKIKRT